MSRKLFLYNVVKNKKFVLLSFKKKVYFPRYIKLKESTRGGRSKGSEKKIENSGR